MKKDGELVEARGDEEEGARPMELEWESFGHAG